MGAGPSDDVRSGAVLAIVWGAYETLRWYFERHPSVDAQTVVLLDPVGNEDAARASFPGKWGRVDCIPAIPSDRDGDTEMFSYTQPGLFSVQPATPALRALFPGLRTRDVLTAGHVSAEKLAASLGGEKENLSLVLEAPGAEMSVLEYIENAGLLERVSTIHMRCGAGIFFENAVDEDRILDWLKARFFKLVARNDEDADWPLLALEPDVNARRLPELETRVHALEKAIVERDADIVAAQAARQRLEADVEAAQAGRLQLEKALDEARGQAEAHKAVLVERDAALKALQAEREQLDKALKNEVARVESHKAATSRLQNTLSENGEALARAMGDSARAREDMSEMLKSLRVAQADLADLRGRYSNLHDEKTRLEQLIQKLTPRLQEAAGQLRELFVSPSDKPASIERSRRKKTAKEGK